MRFRIPSFPPRHTRQRRQSNAIAEIGSEAGYTRRKSRSPAYGQAKLPQTTLLKVNAIPISKLIIEVPHANDFLLKTISNKDFKNFTLWSQHLVLHTRVSLYRFLQCVGFEQINITGVQRYPLSNHLNWLANGRPGGHKSSLSIIDSKNLNEEYENALARIDATDTLVALAKVP